MEVEPAELGSALASSCGTAPTGSSSDWPLSAVMRMPCTCTRFQDRQGLTVGMLPGRGKCKQRQTSPDDIRQRDVRH